MNTMKMIAELKMTCSTIEAEKNELVARVKELDDNLTGYRMAIDALELTLQKKSKDVVSQSAVPVVATVNPAPDARIIAPKNPHGGKHNMKMIEYNGKKQSVNDWAKELGMTSGGLNYRLTHGWSLADALSNPKHPGNTGPKAHANKNAARKVFKYDAMNNPIRQYMSLSAAAADLRMSETTIQKTIEHVSKGEQLKAHNWYLAYAK